MAYKPARCYDVTGRFGDPATKRLQNDITVRVHLASGQRVQVQCTGYGVWVRGEGLLVRPYNEAVLVAPDKPAEGEGSWRRG